MEQAFARLLGILPAEVDLARGDRGSLRRAGRRLLRRRHQGTGGGERRGAEPAGPHHRRPRAGARPGRPALRHERHARRPARGRALGRGRRPAGPGRGRRHLLPDGLPAGAPRRRSRCRRCWSRCRPTPRCSTRSPTGSGRTSPSPTSGASASWSAWWRKAAPPPWTRLTPTCRPRWSRSCTPTPTSASSRPGRWTLAATALEGYEVYEEGEFGEWNLMLYLLDGVSDGVATIAAGGWGGDAYRIHWNGTDIAFAYLFEGDTPRDAGELADALVESLGGQHGRGARRSPTPRPAPRSSRTPTTPSSRRSGPRCWWSSPATRGWAGPWWGRCNSPPRGLSPPSPRAGSAWRCGFLPEWPQVESPTDRGEHGSQQDQEWAEDRPRGGDPAHHQFVPALVPGRPCGFGSVSANAFDTASWRGSGRSGHCRRGDHRPQGLRQHEDQGRLAQGRAPGVWPGRPRVLLHLPQAGHRDRLHVHRALDRLDRLGESWPSAPSCA